MEERAYSHHHHHEESAHGQDPQHHHHHLQAPQAGENVKPRPKQPEHQNLPTDPSGDEAKTLIAGERKADDERVSDCPCKDDGDAGNGKNFEKIGEDWKEKFAGAFKGSMDQYGEDGKEEDACAPNCEEIHPCNPKKYTLADAMKESYTKMKNSVQIHPPGQFAITRGTGDERLPIPEDNGYDFPPSTLTCPPDSGSLCGNVCNILLPVVMVSGAVSLGHQPANNKVSDSVLDWLYGRTRGSRQRRNWANEDSNDPAELAASGARPLGGAITASSIVPTVVVCSLTSMLVYHLSKAAYVA